jgi:uncharacterized Zn-finger protein
MDAESVSNTSEILEDSDTNTNIQQDQTKQEKKHPCLICGKTFSRAYSLFIHEHIHTGEKPYSCDACEKAFSERSDLTSHKMTHTGEKQYPCNICKKTFSCSSNLTKHKRIHTGEKPYQCNLCKMAFSRSNDLNVHKRIHTGDNPFQCNTCEKSFSQGRNLTSHERTHTGEKPYSCVLCRKSYSDLSNFNRHNKSAAHLKRKASWNKDTQSNLSSFVDFGERIKEEIKVEETLDMDPLSIQMEAGENIVNTEDMDNYEDIDFPVFGHVQIEQVKIETNEENQVDKNFEQRIVHEEELNKHVNIKHNDEVCDNVSNQDLYAMNSGEGNFSNNVVGNIEENVK